MGIAGSCAKSYFNIFDRLILSQKEDFLITGRTKRPPLDPVYAVLSFLYTIMTSSYTSALESVGLDSYYGSVNRFRKEHIILFADSCT